MLSLSTLLLNLMCYCGCLFLYFIGDFFFFPFWDEAYLDCCFVPLKSINVLSHLLKLKFNPTISFLNYSLFLPNMVQAITLRWAFLCFCDGLAACILIFFFMVDLWWFAADIFWWWVHLVVFEQNLSWLWLCMCVWVLVVDDVTIWGCPIGLC